MSRLHLPLSVKSACAVGLVVLLAGGGSSAQQTTPKTTPKIPQPGVPQIMTLEGEFIRIAYNSEGYVSLTYRVANESVGKDWMLLEVGTTLRRGVQNYTLNRGSITLDTPDGKKVPLASNQDYLNVDLRGPEMMATNVPESVNYFPPDANQACRLGFFAVQDKGVRAYDDVDLSFNRACVGRLYFKVPGGIKLGQHWLNVQFKSSVVRVPFKILTKEEEKALSKTWKDIKKQVDEAFKGGK